MNINGVLGVMLPEDYICKTVKINLILDFNFKTNYVIFTVLKDYVLNKSRNYERNSRI